MVTKLDVIRAFKKAAEDGKETELMLDEKAENICERETGKIICDLDFYVEYLRSKFHCNFESIYYEHGTLTDVVRCKDCGTIIFTGDDYDRFDPYLRCPNCGDYKTHLEYWTQEEIDSDESKQAEIEALKKMQADRIEMEARRERRKGKNDWEIGKYEMRNEKRHIVFSLECEDLFRSGLKGLNLHISKFSRKDDMAYTSDWFKRIPLSPYAFYRFVIFPKTAKGKQVLSPIN